MPSHTSERLAALVPVVELGELRAPRPASVASDAAWRVGPAARPAARGRHGGGLAAGLGLGVAIGLAVGLGLGVAVGVGLGIGVGIGLDVAGRLYDELF
jgi:predicted lipid-binding transport protein (Tim44 family)